MQIFYKGQLGFVLRGDSASVALGTSPAQTGDENVVVTAEADHAFKPKRDQAVFDWPGEYESRGVSVTIIPIGKEKISRAVKVMLDGVAFAHLDPAETLTEAEEEKIGNIDILFIAAGKAAKLPIKTLQNVIEGIDPRIVIPMNFAPGEELEFAKALGFSEAPVEDSFKFKKSALPIDRMELLVLTMK